MNNHQDNPKGDIRSRVTRLNRDRRFGKTRAFTLIELLVVIAIIILLVAIGTPVALTVLRETKRKTSQTMVNTLVGACNFYHNDWDEYPPSSPKGAELLCDYLTGYRSDDGQAGYGFRQPIGAEYGKITHGPYGGAENLKTNGADTPAFADDFENKILYYRFDTNTQAFNSGDNPNGPPDFAAYSQQAPRNIMLCTPGPNGEWEAPGSGESDDITNFSD